MLNTHELYEKTLGIVGFGNIGKRVAHLAYGFGANIIFYEKLDIPYATKADLQARQVSLEELLTTADIVTLHVPSMEASRNLITWKELSLMKPTAYIINTSRGAVINEADLIRALNEKKIAGAGIDVWEPEPPDPKNPLLHMENVVATPHAGAMAWENWRPRVQSHLEQHPQGLRRERAAEPGEGGLDVRLPSAPHRREPPERNSQRRGTAFNHAILITRTSE